MKLHCPHCGVKGSADDSYLGRKVKCPKCQGVFEAMADMSVELAAETASLAAAVSTPVTSSTVTEEAAAPITLNEAEVQTLAAEVLAGDEAEEMLDLDDELPEAGPPVPPPAQEITTEEEPLNWEDIASEIDLQLAEGDVETEQAEIPEGSPVDIGSLQDDFDQPTADETVAPEVAAVAGNQDEEFVLDAVQLVEETDEIEPEPVDIDKKQCWQCGKSDSNGDSFITRNGQLYCPDCAPIEDSAKVAQTSKEQETEDSVVTPGATDGSSDKSSLGTALKKAWGKMKGVFSRS